MFKAEQLIHSPLPTKKNNTENKFVRNGHFNHILFGIKLADLHLVACRSARLEKQMALLIHRCACRLHSSIIGLHYFNWPMQSLPLVGKNFILQICQIQFQRAMLQLLNASDKHCVEQRPQASKEYMNCSRNHSKNTHMPKRVKPTPARSVTTPH